MKCKLHVVVVLALGMQLMLLWGYARLGRGAEGVGIPEWVYEVKGEEGGLLLHEIFDSARTRNVQWVTDRSRSVPNVKPRGWTPVEPLDFDSPLLHWFNKPSQPAAYLHPVTGNLVVVPNMGADFSPGADTGHFLHMEVPQSPEKLITAVGRFATRKGVVDSKVGLLARRGPTAWAGITLTPATIRTYVVSGGIVDEAVVPSVGREASLRIEMRGDTVAMYSNTHPKEDPSHWFLIRTASLTDEGDEIGKTNIAVGVYAGAPSQSGMTASIGYLSLTSSE